ncbi:MAG: alkane 1-monooxygenase [Bacteroidia bacterium]
MKDLKYLSGYLLPWSTFLAIKMPETRAFFPLIFAFVIIPLVEAFVPADNSNISIQEESERKQNRLYDFMLYLSFPIQWSVIIYFVWSVSTKDYTTLQLIGITTGAGLCSGVLGINAAHELGHRKSLFERLLSQGLLLSSLYTHFYIEHNRGHHKHVATPDDPASARLNETLYHFIPRSVAGSYLSAWRIQLDLLRKNNQSFLSIHNNMLIYVIMQLALPLIILAFGGMKAMLCFLAAAAIGIALLETINYIEHYGMRRNLLPDGKYEKVLPRHSWNANYPIGRMFLFELTRHADHHYKASKKYQTLKHWDESPELPAGYPAMMLLSTIPPLWFYVMNPRVEQVNTALS